MTEVQINVGWLTISELIAITYEAQNKRPIKQYKTAHLLRVRCFYVLIIPNSPVIGS